MLGTFGFGWLMLPLGVALGAYWSRRQSQPSGGAVSAPPAATGDFEARLSLGEASRRNGQIDRALQIHRALLDQPGLDAAQAARARHELACDHVQAGVLDRAESLIEDNLRLGLMRVEGTELLLQIREQGREWRAAIESAEVLESLKSINLKPRIAHYLCELADEAPARDSPKAQRALYEQALAFDPQGPRPLLALMRLAAAESPQAALDRAASLFAAAPRHAAEALPDLERCHRAAGRLSELDVFLREQEARAPHPALTALRARLMLERQEDAGAYVLEKMDQAFGGEALDVWFEAQSRQTPSAEGLGRLRAVLARVFAQAPRYACGHCGFQPKTLQWRCPRCKQWGQTAPLANR